LLSCFGLGNVPGDEIKNKPAYQSTGSLYHRGRQLMTSRRNFLTGAAATGIAFCGCGMLDAARAQPKAPRLPVKIGDLLILKSSVNRAFNTSMEIGVKCWVENYVSGKTRHVASAYLTFVAVDEHGKRKPVPPLIQETEEDKRRYEDAGRRRELRMEEAARRAEITQKKANP